MKKIINFLKNLLICIVKDDFPGMAGEMAFIFTMALFPFLIFLVALFGLVGTESQIQLIITSMRGIIPVDIMSIVETILKSIVQSSSNGIMTFGLIASLFIASNAMAVIIKGLNRAFNIQETRPYWYTRWLSVVMLVVNAMVMFIGANLIIFGKTILQFIAFYTHLPYALVSTVLLIRWPIAFLALYTMAFLNYYFMPNIAGDKKLRLLSTYPGSLFFCLFWLFASWAFSLYVENFGMFNRVYGTIGGFAVLLLWLYYTSLVILIGGEINSQVYKRLLAKETGVEVNLTCY